MMEEKKKKNGCLKWGLIALGAFILLSIIAAILDDGNKEENGINPPEFTLLNVDTPEVQPNGEISPAENLEYTIEIPHALQKDSLELLQNYLINMGKGDYPNVNKVIVRVYTKGMSNKSMPYASLLLIGDNKEIQITGGMMSIDFINEKLSGYKILGCWTVYEESDYILCQKDGHFFETYVNKKDQTISNLEPMSTKKRKGATAYYSPTNHDNEYMIIMEDGLYIYNEKEESGGNAVVWSNDPLWIDRE